MSNSYYKALNHKLNAGYKDELMFGLQQDLKKSVNADKDDLYSEIINLGTTKARDLDINLLLKYYMLNQIMAENSDKEKVYFQSTKNPNIKVDKQGKYHRVVNFDVKEEPGIQEVNEDGSYVVCEKRHTNALKILKTYNVNDQITSIQVVDSAGNVNSNKNIVAELIGLRREFKRRYKRSGYSGNSNDMFATLRNMFSSPIETGYFIDFHCLFYKWQSSTSSFVRIFSREADSPYLVDIEFRDNGTVIRQEYTGVVA